LALLQFDWLSTSRIFARVSCQEKKTKMAAQKLRRFLIKKTESYSLFIALRGIKTNGKYSQPLFIQVSK
jgi:hypothetical protein